MGDDAKPGKREIFGGNRVQRCERFCCQKGFLFLPDVSIHYLVLDLFTAWFQLVIYFWIFAKNFHSLLVEDFVIIVFPFS